MSRVMLCVLHVVQVQLLQHMNICVVGTKDSKEAHKSPRRDVSCLPIAFKTLQCLLSVARPLSSSFPSQPCNDAFAGNDKISE